MRFALKIKSSCYSCKMEGRFAPTNEANACIGRSVASAELVSVMADNEKREADGFSLFVWVFGL